MPVRLPNLNISEQAQTTVTPAVTGKLDNIAIVCTRATAGKGTAADNVPVKVGQVSEIVSLIGTVPNIVTDTFERIKAIAPSATIWLVAGSDLDAVDNERDDLTAGYTALLRSMWMPLCVVICPEGFTQATQSDRLAVYNAGQSMAATDKWDWIHLWNLPTTTITAAAAQTEGATLLSPQGNSSIFHGWSKNGVTRDVPIAADAAAHLVNKNQNASGFYGFGGLWATIGGTFNTQYSVSDTEWKTLLQSGINTAWMIPTPEGNAQWVVYGDTTRAVDAGWTSVASRLAFSVAQGRINDALVPFLWEPENPPVASVSDAQVDSIARMIGAIHDVMADLITEGAVSYPPNWQDGDPIYRIVNRRNANGFLAPSEVRFHPIKLRREISITLINTPTP